jgi:hypothetical protein
VVSYEAEKLAGATVRKCLDCLALVLPWDTDGHDRWHANLDDALAMTRVKIVHTQHQVMGVVALGYDSDLKDMVLLCMAELPGDQRCVMFRGHPGRCKTGAELAEQVPG